MSAMTFRLMIKSLWSKLGSFTFRENHIPPIFQCMLSTAQENFHSLKQSSELDPWLLSTTMHSVRLHSLKHHCFASGKDVAV